MSSPFGFDTEPIVIKQPDILINNPSPIMEKKPTTIIEEPVQKPPPSNSEKFQTTDTPRVNLETAKQSLDIQSNWSIMTGSVIGGVVVGVLLGVYFLFSIAAAYSASVNFKLTSLMPIWMKVIYGLFAFLSGPFYFIYIAIKDASFTGLVTKIMN
jgi:hypothetical protein